MSKKNNKSNRTEAAKLPAKSTSDGVFLRVISNTIIALILIVVLYIGKTNNVGYAFMWDTLVKQNYAMVKENSHIPYLDRNEQRHGVSYKYLADIKKQTPEDALILMPADSSLNKVDPKYGFNELKNRTKATFFLYPRKPLYRTDTFDRAMLPKATYVAIFSGDGYADVPNPPADRNPFTVIKIK